MWHVPLSYRLKKLRSPLDNAGLWMAIDFFSSTIQHIFNIRWWLKFLIAERGASMCYHFGKKNSTFTFFVRQSNTFNRHLMVSVWWMMAEILWSPSNGGVMSNGNHFFSIAIWHTPFCPMATEIFWLLKQKAVSYDFGKPLMRAFQKKMSKAFQKHITRPRFLVTKGILLPSDNGNLSKKFNCHPTHPHYQINQSSSLLRRKKNRAWIYLFSKMVA